MEKHVDYDRIENAWQAINGENSQGRFFFIAHLIKKTEEGNEWVAFLRTPKKDDRCYVDLPFFDEMGCYSGFADPGDADAAVYERAYKKLGWRIDEIDANCLPTEVDEGLLKLL